MRVLATDAALWRDKIAVGTPASRLARRIASPKPSYVFSHTRAMASGVTSRAAGPVPPVVHTSAQPAATMSRSADAMSEISSGTIRVMKWQSVARYS